MKWSAQNLLRKRSADVPAGENQEGESMLDLARIKSKETLACEPIFGRKCDVRRAQPCGDLSASCNSQDSRPVAGFGEKKPTQGSDPKRHPI